MARQIKLANGLAFTVLLALLPLAAATARAGEPRPSGKGGAAKPAQSREEKSVAEDPAAGASALESSLPANPIAGDKKLKADLEVWPERVRKELSRIEAKLKGMDLSQVKAERMLASDFVDVLSTIDEEAALIAESYAGITPLLARWREAVERSPEAFRAIGAAFDAKAAEADEPEFKQHYSDFAGAARDMASKYEKKARSLAKLEADLQGKLLYVAKSRRFIGDVKSFLESLPATDDAVEVERFAKRLNDYIAVFNEAVKSLKDLSREVGTDREPPVSPGSKQAPGQRPRPMASRGRTADDYKAAFAELRASR